MNSTNSTRETNNKVTIVGELVSNYKFSHEVFGEGFYTVKLKTDRTSSNSDILELTLSERLADVTIDPTGSRVSIQGQFRSFNKHEESGNHLVLQVFVSEIGEAEEYEDDCDIIELNGFICKQPVYRKTPLGREIADVLIAVNRPYGKSDYIPCICWGRNARFAGTLDIGSHIEIRGRIQSREYFKRKPDGEKEETPRVAYEVSASYIHKLEDDE